MRTLNFYIPYPGVAMDIVFTCSAFGGFWRAVEIPEGRVSRMLGGAFGDGSNL